MKKIVHLIIVIVLFSSCSGTKFLNRKYTTGNFFENKNLVSKPKLTKLNHQILVDSSNIFLDKLGLTKSDSILLATSIIDNACHNKESEVLYKKQSYSNIIKHNTIYTDTTKFTSLINKIYLQTTNKSRNTNYINKISNKKDSIYIKQRKGRDSVYGKSSQLQPVIIILNSNNKIIKTIKGKEANKYSLSRIKNNSIVALCLSLIPVLGFIISTINRNRLKKYDKIFKTNKTKEIKKINTIALIISIFSLAFLIGIIAYLFYLISLVSISFGLII